MFSGKEIEMKKNTNIAMKYATLLLLADDIVIYIENWRDCNEKLVQIMREFSKVYHKN